MDVKYKDIKDRKISISSEWSYKYPSSTRLHGTQEAWNHTLLTVLNKINAESFKRYKFGVSIILINSKVLEIFNTLEFFKDNSIGTSYRVVVDDEISNDCVYMLSDEIFDNILCKIDIKDFSQKTALIAGVTGQDGSYLSELLLEKGYKVHGIIRRSSTFNTGRIEHLMNNVDFELHYGDVTDPLNINTLISNIQPDEIYNLAAQSHVAVSFEVPLYTAQVDALGTLNILEAMRTHCSTAKFYQASTSELFGGMEYNKNEKGFYDEESPMHPRSPYGVAKLYGYWIIKNYRKSYGLYACNGILFNHESERRGKTFVTRKITTNLVQVKKGARETLSIGNLDSERDWGHAQPYVKGMWLMLQQNDPKDYVLATGKTHKVRTFVEMTAKHLGWNIEWRGEGVDEKGYDKETGRLLVEVNPKYFRPSEVDRLIGDPTKAKTELGWDPEIDLDELVERMVKHDLENE